MESINYRKGIALAIESSYFAAIAIKALKEKDVDDEILLELYEYLLTYCDVMGPLIAFTESEMDFLLAHLCGHVQQTEQTNIQLHQSHVPKRGLKKRGRADLNVDTDSAPQVNPAVHAAALKCLTAVLVSDPRSVTEPAFKSVAASVANEVMRVNAHRYSMSNTCVYAEPRNRKLLYKLLSDVAQYPIHPVHRPLHIALRIFAETASWDNRDQEFRIPTFCRKALLSLVLITDPVIAPRVCHSEPATAAVVSDAITADADEVVSEEALDDNVLASVEITAERHADPVPCVSTVSSQPPTTEQAAVTDASVSHQSDQTDDVFVMELSDDAEEAASTSKVAEKTTETITIDDDDDEDDDDDDFGNTTVVANDNFEDESIKPEKHPVTHQGEEKQQQQPEPSCSKNRPAESQIQSRYEYSGSIFDESPDADLMNGTDLQDDVILSETVPEIMEHGDFAY